MLQENPMLISNDYSVNNIFDVPNEHQTKKVKDFSVESGFDTVSISDAAMEAYTKSKLGNIDEEASENDLLDQFKKQFNSYRGKGIFNEDSDTNAQKSIEGDTVTDGSSGTDDIDKVTKKASELERKIKDLTEQLESVMQSNLPDTEKEAMAGQIQKQISELQSQLAAYKQTEKYLSSL